MDAKDNTLTEDQKQWHAGWDAWNQGIPRDASKGFHWLQGWDARDETFGY